MTPEVPNIVPVVTEGYVVTQLDPETQRMLNFVVRRMAVLEFAFSNLLIDRVSSISQRDIDGHIRNAEIEFDVREAGQRLWQQPQ